MNEMDKFQGAQAKYLYQDFLILSFGERKCWNVWLRISEWIPIS